MKLNKQSIYLAFSGILLLAIGAFIAIWPLEYLSQFKLARVEMQSSFLSELRGMGGTLLIFSLFILWSVTQKKLQYTALIISSLIFSAFVIFRVIGIIFDGMPEQGILIALMIEIIFSIIAIGLTSKVDGVFLEKAH